MLLRVTHTTDLTYSDLISESVMELRMCPRQEGDQPRPGEPMGEIAQRILDLINNRFSYQQGITTAASPITECLAHGQGVCQDFTHLMIGLARALGIPARYVSGLVHPDQQRYRGFSQTHAWCELLFPTFGWVGFDPTNHCTVSQNFVKVGIGRAYRTV